MKQLYETVYLSFLRSLVTMSGMIPWGMYRLKVAKEWACKLDSLGVCTIKNTTEFLNYL